MSILASIDRMTHNIKESSSIKRKTIAFSFECFARTVLRYWTP